jgi:hypothetical protein
MEASARPVQDDRISWTAASCQKRTFAATAIGDAPLRRSSHPGHRCPVLVIGFATCLEDGMTIRGLMTQTMGVGLLLMSGCQATRNMGDDFSRVMSSQPTSAQIRNNAAVTPATRLPRPRPPQLVLPLPQLLRPRSLLPKLPPPRMSALRRRRPVLPPTVLRLRSPERARTSSGLCSARPQARRNVRQANDGVIGTGNARWTSSSIQMSRPSSSELLRTR